MIFQFGTVLLVGLLSALPLSDLGEYQYKAECNLPNFIKSAYLDCYSDDDEYWYTFDVALSFDLYFNSGTTTYYTDDYEYSVDIYRHYLDSDLVVATYHIVVNTTESRYSYDLEDLTTIVTFNMYHENDTCIFNVLSSTRAVLGTGNTVVLPLNEEFLDDYGFEFILDYSSLYSQLNDFRTYYVSYVEGYQGGYNTGYTDGYNTGLGVGYDNGVGDGYQSGYTQGYTDADNQDATAAVIFTGILEVALLPINVFLAIFNYEVFGINISGLVSALLTVAIVVIVIRVILAKSGGNGGGNKS